MYTYNYMKYKKIVIWINPLIIMRGERVYPLKKTDKKVLQLSVFSITLMILALPIITLFLIRLFSERHLDDVNSLINCNEDLLKKSDVFAVIPKYKNISISENKTWCENILKYNKKLIMHGIYHTYKEFLKDRNQSYLDEGSKIFEECFNFSPKEFKPPQLEISKNNKVLIKKNFKLDSIFQQSFHKVYHCEDSGKFSNRFNDL